MKAVKRRRKVNQSLPPQLSAALRKTPRIHFAALQGAREQARDHDVKRLVRGLATPEQIRQEAQLYTDEQLKTFTAGNFEAVPADAPISPMAAPEIVSVFATILAAAKASGIKLVIAGDHATDFWGRYYMPQEPGMREFLPQVSRTLTAVCDFGGMLAMAAALEAPCQRVHGGPHRPVLGVVTVDQGAGAHRIEFVRRIPGLRPADLARETAEMGSPRLGVSVLVLAPFACLKARVQEAAHYLRPREEDLSHLMTLILCNRALLRDAIKAVENETLPESKALAALRAALRFVLTRPAVHAATMHQLDWLQAFPVVELLKTSRVRLQRFLANGLQARFPSCPRAMTDPESAPEQQQAA